MNDALEEAHAPQPFPMIRTLLKNRRLVIAGGTAGVALLGFWAAFRTGVADLYVVSLLLAGAAHFVLKVAVEVIELVAETLMPR